MSDGYSPSVPTTSRFLSALSGPPLVALAPPLPSLETVLEFVRHGDTSRGVFFGTSPAAGTTPPPPAPDDFASAELTNLLVRVFLHSCTNTTVTGDGVNMTDFARVVMNWFIENADDEFPEGQTGANLPPPGESMNYPTVHGIYRAIRIDGCLSSEFIPIGLSAFIDTSPGIELGNFSGFEPDTIRRGGVWAFEFDILASRDEGANESNFRFRGMIDATCTHSASSAP